MVRSRPLWRLTAAERKVWEAYPSGSWVDLRTGDADRDDPAGGATWGRERTVRAELLTALLLGARPAAPGQVAGLRLAGARVVGTLNLSDATITTKLHLLNCHLSGTVALTDATTKGVRFRGCDVRRIRAARCTIDGLFELDSCTVRAGVRLDNAHITGQLRLARATLFAPDGTSAASESYKADARRAFGDAEKQERGWDQHHWALWAGGLTVDGGAFCRDLRSTGGLRLIGAKFNSGLYLQRAVIESTGGHAVYADHMQATSVEFSENFTAEGTVRLRGARVSGVLSFDQAKLSAQGRALHLSHMQVDELILRPASVRGEVNLGYSRVGVLLDDPRSYPGRVRLNGLVVESIRGNVPLSDRLAWLGRDPEGYRPQPYEHLAAWYRRIGHEQEARRVLLAKQRARRATIGVPGRLAGLLLDVVVGYGYRPWLAGVWFALLLTAGTVVFATHPPAQVGLDERRLFHAFPYTLDLLVPVSVFEQRGAWEPVGWTQWVAGILIASGWVLATALIAGGTRLLRPSTP
ncbi:oxidoreductase [Sphaerisporangium melleum]|uniref:Oxidoreductase n=1 Tax=Sphaerisporangium melleum TaxID=321316 RepID=A0A917VQ38_9ACTN|nr:pentapeptide repeat-containing protein [Sphaerisporangium melleum]GGL07580.1 oxidoreductase [Sphaerisporangium melleum]GII68675.1 oxidoreductase [Sphaerisporangium melleum]